MQRDSIRSPFGGLLDEIRVETVQQAASQPRPSGTPARASHPGPAPDLRLEAGVVSEDERVPSSKAAAF